MKGDVEMDELKLFHKSDICFRFHSTNPLETSQVGQAGESLRI